MEDDEPLPPDPSERRKVQNRNAQRKFRNRRHRHQINQALQNGTVPPTQPLSWPLLYDSQVLAASNLLSPPQQPHVQAPQCDPSTLSQQPQVSSHSSGTIPTSENTTNQANDLVFLTSASNSEAMVNDAEFHISASDSDPMVMSYLSSLDSVSPMFDHDVAPAFPIPPHDSSNGSTAISMADSRSIRPMASDPHTTQAPYATSLPPSGSKPQDDLPIIGDPHHQVPLPAPQQPLESRGNSPDYPASENNNSSSNSSNRASPASSNSSSSSSSKPTDSEVNKNNDTMSVLHIALHRGHTAILSILLTHKLDPNEPDGSGRPPLHLAAMNGHTTVASLLLSHGACINATDSLGRTALHWAVLRGHEGVVKVLLDAGGADLNLRDRNDWSVLHVAVERGFEGTLKMLLRHGADRRLKARKCEGWKKGEREAEDESSTERVVMEG